jgi:hypothetical protein
MNINENNTRERARIRKENKTKRNKKRRRERKTNRVEQVCFVPKWQTPLMKRETKG